MEAQFTERVQEQLAKELELRDRDLARRHKLSFEKERTKLTEQLTAQFNHQLEQMKADLNAQMAEVARLKSLEQVRMRKWNEQKKEMIEQIQNEKRDVEKKH